jgi:hypothetical protein
LCSFLVLVSGQYCLIEWVCCFLCFQFLKQFWNWSLFFFKFFVAFTFSIINLLLQYCSSLYILLHCPSVFQTSIPTFPFMVTSYYMKMWQGIFTVWLVYFCLLNSRLYHKLTSSQLTPHSGSKVVSGHYVTLGLCLAAPLWVVNPVYSTVFQVSSLQIASTEPHGWLQVNYFFTYISLLFITCELWQGNISNSGRSLIANSLHFDIFFVWNQYGHSSYSHHGIYCPSFLNVFNLYLKEILCRNVKSNSGVNMVYVQFMHFETLWCKLLDN